MKNKVNMNVSKRQLYPELQHLHEQVMIIYQKKCHAQTEPYNQHDI